MIGSRSSACAAVLWSCLVTSAASGQADDFPYDLPPSLNSGEELLPSGREVCSRLGLDPAIPGRCNTMAALARSGRQTDPSLWFFKSTAGLGPGMDCPGPVAFDRSKANGGVAYLCHAPEEDVAITPEELSALAAEASRLNALQHKTLAEHTRALDLKTAIDCITSRQISDCD